MSEGMIYHQAIKLPYRYTAGENNSAFLEGLTGDNIEELIDDGRESENDLALPKSLTTGLEISGVRSRTRKALGRTRRLAIDKLSIPAGQKVAIVGEPSSGKSSLLRSSPPALPA